MLSLPRRKCHPVRRLPAQYFHRGALNWGPAPAGQGTFTPHVGLAPPSPFHSPVPRSNVSLAQWNLKLAFPRYLGTFDFPSQIQREEV